MALKIKIICVPYDSGRADTRMGLGPHHILKSGLLDRLSETGHETAVCTIVPETPFCAEVATSFSLMSQVSREVRAAVARSEFPVVLAGTCNISVGTASGLAPAKIGVVWFDGHADLNTPNMTTTGFIDGVGLAILCGQCWHQLANAIPGFTPIEERNVILCGASDIDPLEWEYLRQSQIRYLSDRDLSGSEGTQQLRTALENLAKTVSGVHLHIDLDVHDPRIACANHFRPPGGLSPETLKTMVQVTSETIPILSTSVTAFDPAQDHSGIVLRSCTEVLSSLVEGLAPRSTLT